VRKGKDKGNEVGTVVVERQTLTVSECAEVIGISRNRAYELCAENVIPNHRLGGRIVIPKTALDEWLASAGKRQAADGGS
jgi:excisionase family DNA binding protein